LLLATSLRATFPTSLEFHFIGDMAFAITDGKTTLYTDFPYRSGAFGYMTYEMSAVPPARDALCLVTHAHLDHFDPSLFRKMDAALIAPPSLVAQLETARAVQFAPKMSYRDIAIEAFRTPHGDIEHYSYLVTWHGLRLYFAGDTDSTERLLAMRDLDVAFVSPWLIEAVAKRGARIDARQLVAYHHRSGETVAALQGRRVPKQGEDFVVEAHEPHRPN
jgi:L-ascorbate metabolism protein UlaG (beta-lactamase superfamily)